MSKNQKLKNDIILALSVILIALGVFLVFNITKKQGGYAVVLQNGKELSRYSLSSDFTTDISYNGKSNTLVIKNGKAYVLAADCPDKVCVSHRKISKEGETIVCLPHKLVIAIE